MCAAAPCCSASHDALAQATTWRRVALGAGAAAGVLALLATAATVAWCRARREAAAARTGLNDDGSGYAPLGAALGLRGPRQASAGSADGRGPVAGTAIQ
jgi:hypothetical protein